MPILIRTGFSLSTISSIVVIFSMKYFFKWSIKRDFFTDHNDELLDADINQIDDNANGVNFDDELNDKYESKNDKINGEMINYILIFH